MAGTYTIIYSFYPAALRWSGPNTRGTAGEITFELKVHKARQYDAVTVFATPRTTYRAPTSATAAARNPEVAQGHCSRLQSDVYGGEIELRVAHSRAGVVRPNAGSPTEGDSRRRTPAKAHGE